MKDLERAEEHLQVIRTLMERATIYRAISAPTALVGGALAVITSLEMLWTARTHGLSNERFILTWLVVLAVTLVVNTAFIWYEASRRGEPLLSASMKLALTALFPGMLAGFFATLCYAKEVVVLAPLWVIFYGIALLATSHFAPRSITWLGWAFLGSGLLLLTQLNRGTGSAAPAAAVLTMGATFGLFHLIYAFATWPRRKSADA